jgi:hypothetical protein
VSKRAVSALDRRSRVDGSSTPVKAHYAARVQLRLAARSMGLTGKASRHRPNHSAEASDTALHDKQRSLAARARAPPGSAISPEDFPQEGP